MANIKAGRVAMTMPESGRIIWVPASDVDSYVESLYGVFGPSGSKPRYQSIDEAKKDIVRPIRLGRLETQSASSLPGDQEVLYETKEVPADYFEKLPREGKPFDFIRRMRIPGITSAGEWAAGGPQYWTGEGAPVLNWLGGAALGESETLVSPTGRGVPVPEKPVLSPQYEGDQPPRVVGPIPGPMMMERRFRGGVLPMGTQLAALLAGGEMTRGMNAPGVPASVRFGARPAIVGGAGAIGGTVAAAERQWAQDQPLDLDKALVGKGAFDFQSGLGQGVLGTGIAGVEGAAAILGGRFIESAYRRLPVFIRQYAKKYGAEPTPAWLASNDQNIAALKSESDDFADALDAKYSSAGTARPVIAALNRLQRFAGKFSTEEVEAAYNRVATRLRDRLGPKMVTVRTVTPSNTWTVQQRAYYALTGQIPKEVIVETKKLQPAPPLTFREVLDWKRELNKTLEMENATAGIQAKDAGRSASTPTPAARAMKAQMDEVDKLLFENQQFSAGELADAKAIRAKNREMMERITVRDYANGKMLPAELASWRALNDPLSHLRVGRRLVSAAPDATRVAMPSIEAGGAFMRTRGGRLLPLEQSAPAGWQTDVQGSEGR